MTEECVAEGQPLPVTPGTRWPHRLPNVEWSPLRQGDFVQSGQSEEVVELGQTCKCACGVCVRPHRAREEEGLPV